MVKVLIVLGFLGFRVWLIFDLVGWYNIALIPDCFLGCLVNGVLGWARDLLVGVRLIFNCHFGGVVWSAGFGVFTDELFSVLWIWIAGLVG